MAYGNYPEIHLGRESGSEPTRIRAGGRYVTVVGAVLQGGEAVFDNGLLHGKAKVEEGITFGPEVLRALGGTRTVGIWLAAVRNEDGKDGWFGLSAGDMRIDRIKGDGFRDTGSWGAKLTEAAKGRAACWQLKEDEKAALAKLLAGCPDLWKNASRSFRETMSGSIPALADLFPVAEGAAAAVAGENGSLPDWMAPAGGMPPRSLRAYGRDVTILGVLVDGAKAEWDNGAITSESSVEKGITFGPEVLRALGGKRYCAVFVSIANQEDGTPGYYGATVSEMRIDAAKKDGFRDTAAYSMKLNESSRGRVEVSRLKPEERKAFVELLQTRTGLWEAAFETIQMNLMGS